MLVLSRFVNQGITIGDNIRLIVVEVNGQQVRLGIDAPREVKIMREELINPEASLERSRARHPYSRQRRSA